MPNLRPRQNGSGSICRWSAWPKVWLAVLKAWVQVCLANPAGTEYAPSLQFTNTQEFTKNQWTRSLPKSRDRVQKKHKSALALQHISRRTYSSGRPLFGLASTFAGHNNQSRRFKAASAKSPRSSIFLGTLKFPCSNVCFLACLDTYFCTRDKSIILFVYTLFDIYLIVLMIWKTFTTFVESMHLMCADIHIENTKVEFILAERT